jgi:hypothetical protein
MLLGEHGVNLANLREISSIHPKPKCFECRLCFKCTTPLHTRSLLCVYGDEKAAPFEDFLISTGDDEDTTSSATSTGSSNVGGACDAGLGTSCFVTGAFG